MKAQMESCIVGGKAASFPLKGVSGGKVQKKQRKGDEEVNAQEIKEYLTKLQEIVPLAPKNKRLSKVEVISYVIDYIHELRETLGLPACTAEEDCFMADEASCTVTSSACAAATCNISKVCENNNIKKSDSECRVFSGEE